MNESLSVSKGWSLKTLDNKGKWRHQKCYRCSAKATSSEHLPPKNFFSGLKLTAPLLTVPACDLHNNNYSSDDDWLRSIVTQYCGPKSAEARDLLGGKVHAANTRNPKFMKRDYDAFEESHFWTPSGIYGGKRKLKYSFTPEERGCLLNFYERFSRALYWSSTSRKEDLRFKLLDLGISWEKSFVDDCIPGFKLAPTYVVGHPNVFQFKYIGIGEDVNSLVIWTLLFKSMAMFSIINADIQKYSKKGG